MIVYFSCMRVKDDIKQEALFEATIKLVNEIGFAASSVAKIAREAKVSPATLYVYFDNKEDLLVSTYVGIKQQMGAAILRDLDRRRPKRDVLKQVWCNMFAYISAHPQHFRFTEQFAHSPYSRLVDKQKVEAYFAPLVAVLEEGIAEKIIKDVDFDMLAAFGFYPILSLANPNLCQSFTPTRENIEAAFTLAWDAIKL